MHHLVNSRVLTPPHVHDDTVPMSINRLLIQFYAKRIAAGGNPPLAFAVRDRSPRLRCARGCRKRVGWPVDLALDFSIAFRVPGAVGPDFIVSDVNALVVAIGHRAVPDPILAWLPGPPREGLHPTR